MATARIAMGSIMSTISQTANSVSALINTTTKGIGMLDAMVTKASDEQALRHKKDRRQFVKNLQREAAEEEASANIQVLEFCAKSNEHAKLYKTAFDEFGQLFAEELALASPKPSE